MITRIGICHEEDLLGAAVQVNGSSNKMLPDVTWELDKPDIHFAAALTVSEIFFRARTHQTDASRSTVTYLC